MTRAASASRIIASSRPTRSALSTTPPSTSPTTSFSSSRPRAPFTHHARRHLCTVRAHNLSPQRRAQKRKNVQRHGPNRRPTTRPRPPARTTPAAQQDARGRPAPGRRLHALPRHGYSTPSSPARKTSPLTHARTPGASAFIGLGIYSYLSGHSQLRQERARILASKSLLGLRARKASITGLAATLVGLGVYRLVN